MPRTHKKITNPLTKIMKIIMFSYEIMKIMNMKTEHLKIKTNSKY